MDTWKYYLSKKCQTLSSNLYSNVITFYCNTKKTRLVFQGKVTLTEEDNSRSA